MSNQPFEITRSNPTFDVDAWDDVTILDLSTGRDDEEIGMLIDGDGEHIITIHPDHGYGMDEAVYLYTRYTADGVLTSSKNYIAVWLEECGIVNLLHPLDFLKFYPGLPADLVVRIYNFAR